MIIYLIVINIVSFFMYALDKRYAIKSKSRIPEKNLLVLSVVGGALGGVLAMNIVHHKTKKIKFLVINYTSLLIYILVILYSI